MGGSFPYAPYGYYVPMYNAPPPPATQDIEAALAHGEEHWLTINRNQTYTTWNNNNFPGFNIEV
jgi:hypothetical protein